MKKTFLLMAFCLMTAMTWAAKADPTPTVITQPDGTQLTVMGYGDEDLHWFTTSDGVLLSRIGRSYYVAKVNNDGELVATTQLAHEKSLRSAAETQLVANQDKQRFFNHAPAIQQQRAARRISIGTTTPSYFPHVGSPKAVVLLVEFSDTTFTAADPKATFNDYLNGEGTLTDRGINEARNYSSVRQFFSDMSEGQFTPQFDIYGPYKLDKASAYYGAGDSDNMTALFKDACDAADNDVDFAQYDADNDGRVDLVYIIYAGYSASIGGNSEDCIWPKSGSNSFGTYDGKNIQRYGVNNELNGNPTAYKTAPTKRINGIGLFCHEFSHTLGLSDHYPTVESACINNQAMEYWDIMDSGTYTDNGYTPTPYTPWEKEVMGWKAIEEITEAGKKTLRADEAVKITQDGSNEYLILHNIQSEGWAQAVSKLGHGMLVYRVDYGKTVVNINDRPNNTAGKPGMTIVPADGLLITSYSVTTAAEQNTYLLSHAGDPYPGTSNVTEIETVTMNNTTFEKPIYNITEEDGVISFRFLEKLKEFDEQDNHYVISEDNETQVEITNGNENASSNLVIEATVTYDDVDYTVTSIGSNAFANNTTIETLILPETIETIGEGAFSGCTAITTVTMTATTPPTAVKAVTEAKNLRAEAADINLFDTTVYNNATLIVPDGAEETYKAANGWKQFVTIIGNSSTGIRGIDNLSNGLPTASDSKQNIYDISGRRVGGKLQKGIYIIDRKKIVVK